MKMPFEVNRALGVKIVPQVTDGLRMAILTGFYKPGDRLPTVLELAHGLGVLMKITNEFQECASLEVELRERCEAGLAKHITDPKDREVGVFPEDLVDGGNQLHVKQQWPSCLQPLL